MSLKRWNVVVQLLGQNGQLILSGPVAGLSHFYAACFNPGGCHVPSPAGRIDGGVVFGQ